MEQPLDSAAAKDMWAMLDELNSHMWETLMVDRMPNKEAVMAILDRWARRY